MTSRLALLLLCGISLASKQAFAGSRSMASAPSASSQERGFFSVGLSGGYEQTRLLNQDGSYSRFKGYDGSLGLDIRLWGDSNGGEIRLFAQGLVASLKGEAATTDTLVRSSSIYGLKFYPNSFFYLCGGLGQESIKFKNTTGEQTLTSKISGIGGGIEWSIGDGLFMGLGGWYKSGVLSKFENPTLPGNSNFESAEGAVYFIWSPASMTVNYLK